MKYNPEKNHRQSIRLRDYDYSHSGAYFITICINQKECVFGKIDSGKMQINEYSIVVNREWEKTAEIRGNVVLDKYIIMPNHFHGVLILLNDAETVNVKNVGASWRPAPTNNNRISNK